MYYFLKLDRYVFRLWLWDKAKWDQAARDEMFAENNDDVCINKIKVKSVGKSLR